MIEVRTFDGGPEDAHRLILDVWTAAYGGKLPIQAWSPEYFEWELFSTRLGGDDYLIGAYDGSRLVGTLFAEEFTFRLNGEEVRGTNASWLSVHRGYPGGIAKRMYALLQQRHLERQAPFMTGWFYRSPVGRIGYKFWNAHSKLTDVDEVGCWVRVIDHHAVARWEPQRGMRWLSRALGCVQGPPANAAATDGVRPYRREDLPDCLRIVNGIGADADFSCMWTAERLGHQLLFKDMPRTFAAEIDGQPAGFINYYPVELLGRGTIRAGMIDIAAIHRLPTAMQSRLVALMLSEMRDAGLAFAMTIRHGMIPGRPFLTNGFLPIPSQFSFGIIAVDEEFTIKPVRSFFVRPR